MVGCRRSCWLTCLRSEEAIPTQRSTSQAFQDIMGDPRVLEYLRELLHSTDSRFRAQAARVLCCLGELAPALNHADDPSPEVRLSLCEVLGLYRERSGAELLERLLNDPDAEVARNAKKALRRLEDWRRQHRQSRQKGTFRNRITRDCDLPTRKKIVQELRGALHADGYLVLGSTESIMNLESDFKPVAGSGIALYQLM